MEHLIHSVSNGSEFAPYVGPNICELIPPKVKAIESLAGCKEKRKKWKPNDCYCRICKICISNVCFIKNPATLDFHLTELFHLVSEKTATELRPFMTLQILVFLWYLKEV